MTNQDDIDRAKAGREHWNDWAAANPGAKVDFSGQPLDVFNFQRFIFPGDANFSECRFAKNARFTGATFKGKAKLDRITFGEDAVFKNAVFEHDVDMSYAVFNKFTDFRSAAFKGRYTLTNATCAGETDFTKATFADAIFRGVQFDHPLVTFESATYSKVPDFRNSSFKTPPILFGIVVNAPTNQRPAEAPDADKYRWLKLLASDAKDHQGELKFFADELRAKQGHETRGSAFFLSKAYEQVSDFGQSVWLPIRWLLCLFVVSCLVRVAACLPLSLSSSDAVLSHFAVSIADTFLLVGSEKWELRTKAITLAVCSRDFGLWQHVGALLQSALGLTLVFLIGLGLRNRFKMGGSN
jgi:hypothetical protein